MYIDNSLDKKSTTNKWKIVFCITSMLSIIWLIGTATFLFDVRETRFVAKGNDFGITHSCLTGYAVATHLAIKKTGNIYSTSHYTHTSSTLTPIHESVNGTFMIDEYHYPPPFLILPYGLLIIFKEFFSLRQAWFILITIFFIGALIIVSFWCGAFRSQNRLLIFPILLCAPTVHIALQIGNIHILIIAISMLAMIAFEKNHSIVGGALLSFAIVTKIWPVILFGHLVLQRRWKPVFWCAIVGTVYILVGLILFGPEPYWDFITYQLPRISSGESFNFMIWNPQTIIHNMSIFGIPHKLHALNLLSAKPKLISPVLAWCFTIFICLIIITTSFRHANKNNNDRLVKVQLWLALLTLVQLRSPFLPWHYGVISTLWLLMLLATTARGWKLVAIFAAWLCLSVNIPMSFLSENNSLNLGYTLFTSLFIYGAVMISIRRYWKMS